MANGDGNMTKYDWVKLSCAAVGGVCSALIAASVRSWHDALMPPAILGAIVAVCSSLPAWFANTPGKGGGQ